VGAGSVVESLVAALDPLDLGVGEAGEGRTVDGFKEADGAEALAVSFAGFGDGVGGVVFRSCRCGTAPVDGLRRLGLGLRTGGMRCGEEEAGDG